jgi:hypothetical protein
VRVGLSLRGVGAAGREGNLDGVAGLLCGFFDGCGATENDQIGEGDLFAAGLEVLLDRFELIEDLGQFGRLVDFPILLRFEADARAVGSAALVAAAEGCG